ncbi:hypothetical protein ACEPPN_018662 [Leptodophora sp. 'Broadleaf-Isolate-01']
MENRFQDGDAEEDYLYGALEVEVASEQGAFSSEEFANRKAAEMRAFESNLLHSVRIVSLADQRAGFIIPHGVGDSSTIDPWRSLHFIVGQQLTSISTIHTLSSSTTGTLKDLGRREGVFWADKLTVGEVLSECHRHKILNRPGRGDWREYQQQLQTLIRKLELISLWHPVQTYSPFSHVHVVEKILGIKLSKLWQSTWLEVDSQVYPPSMNDSFRCRDMSLELLRKVGKLKIQWTEYITEHLQLDIESSTLKIFRYGFTAMASPIFHQVRIFDEIGATYSLLFHSQRDTGRDNRAQYGQLPIPEWLRVLHGNDRGLLPARQASDMSYFLDEDGPRASDIEYHLLRAHKKLPVSQKFERYEIWGDRLRQLKAYMDSQKPGGIRGLWADKRDSLQWYTFWAVIIVGGASVMLSVLGLMVAIVRTVGTFKGLK